MKKYLIIIAGLIFCIVTMNAKPPFVDVSKQKVNSSKTTSAQYRTTASGWMWKANQWWYNEEPTDTVPPSYTIVEEVAELIVRNGVESKQRYRTTLEVTVSYTTSLPGWVWDGGGRWLYYGKEVNALPPSYVYNRQEIKTTVDLDYDTGEELTK